MAVPIVLWFAQKTKPKNQSISDDFIRTVRACKHFKGVHLYYSTVTGQKKLPIKGKFPLQTKENCTRDVFSELEGESNLETFPKISNILFFFMHNSTASFSGLFIPYFLSYYLSLSYSLRLATYLVSSPLSLTYI